MEIPAYWSTYRGMKHLGWIFIFSSPEISPFLFLSYLENGRLFLAQL